MYKIYFLKNGMPVADWCRENEVPYGSVRVWLDKGLLVDDACKKAKEGHERRKRRKTLMLGNKTLSKAVPQIAYNSILRYVNRMNLSVDEAIALYERRRGKHWKEIRVIHTASGMIFNSIKECAEFLGIKYDKLKYQVRKNIGYVRRINSD